MQIVDHIADLLGSPVGKEGGNTLEVNIPGRKSYEIIKIAYINNYIIDARILPYTELSWRVETWRDQ